MMGKKCLILGATGLVGGFVLKQILEEENYIQINILTRRKIDVSNARVRQQEVDFDKLDSYSEWFEVDSVFCCLGTTIKKAGSKDRFEKVDKDYVVNAAALSRKNGVSQFLVVSAMGANPKSLFFYNKVKGRMEKHVMEQKIPSTIIARPSLLTGPREESRPGEKFGEAVMKIFQPVFTGPLKKFRPIQANHVAKALILTAQQNPPGTVIFKSDELTNLAKSN